MPADQQIGISVPAQLIEDLVRAAIVRELGNQQALVEGIVNQALKKKENSYDKETLFQAEVSKQIREIAKQIVAEWVITQKDQIKAAMMKHLQSADGLAIKKLVEGLVDGVSKYSVSVQFHWKD